MMATKNEIFLRHFGREDLDFDYYHDVIENNGTNSILAKRKLINPVKWLFVLLDYATSYTQLIATLIVVLLVIATILPMFIIALISHCISAELSESIISIYKASMNGAMLLFLGAISIITEIRDSIFFPYNALIQPYVNFFRDKENPVWLTACVIGINLTLISVVITSIVLSGGTLLAPILGLSVLNTNIIASMMSLFLVPAALKSIATATKNIRRSIINMFFREEGEPRLRSDKNQAVIETQQGDQPSKNNNSYTRLLFNSPKSSTVLEPEEQDLSYTFKKLFLPGWAPTSKRGSSTQNLTRHDSSHRAGNKFN